MFQIRSEVGRLRKVLLHEPGPEVDLMVPDMMEELLFDDILYGDRAREEHRRLRSLLETLGVEVCEMFDLLVEALAQDGAREWLLRAMLDDVSGSVADRMRAADPQALAGIFVSGLRFGEQSDVLSSEELFEIVPVPNLCFQRDPQAIVGDSVIFSSMATPTRTREVLLSQVVFRFHPDFRDTPVLTDPLQASVDRPQYVGMHQPRFEGGDIMVLSDNVVVIGYSERTNRSGVRNVVRALTRLENGPRWLIVAALPHKRAFMHLDTVMTQIDHNHCLAFPPVILPGHDDTASVYEFDLHDQDPRPRPCSDLLTALRGRGIDLSAIPCGGDDPLRQQREQWTDGANALALAPGVIVMYERNVATAECLSSHGYDVVEADAVIAKTVTVDLDAPKPTCILLPSHELSRARGGPHCLSQGLFRDLV